MFIGLSIYQILWYFMEYSFIGWVVEVLYHATWKGQIVNRGFLNGPICPIYGVGMIGVIVITNLINSGLDEAGISSGSLRLFCVFIGGTLFATLTELLAGWILDKLFHARWWDYSGIPLNLGGYICLGFSILWGLGILFAIEIVHPLLAVEPTHGLITKTAGVILLAVFYVIFTADLISTVFTMIGINKRLARIDEISRTIHEGSDYLTDKVGGSAYKATVKIQESVVQASLAKAEINKLYEELIKHTHFGAGRLLRAFSTARHTRYQQAFKSLLEKAKSIRRN